MQTYHGIQQLQLSGPTILTIGNFDGVHRGHQALLATLVETAHAMPNAQAALVTFQPHPLTVLRPDVPLQLLTTPPERLQIAAGLGIDIGVIQPFSRDLAALEADEFLALLKHHTGMAALVVGPDFALGRNRSGNLEALANLGSDLGYRLIVQPHITDGDVDVRSKTIRELLAAGNVAAAAQLLGRPYHMAGVVEQGDQRGREFGIPTANLAVPEDKLWPADGVYATRTWVMGAPARGYASVTNIGYRPTVNGRSRRLESHLLDFPEAGQSGNLYGLRLVIQFLQRLRGEKRFDGPQQLIAQIRADIEDARDLFHSLPPAGEPFFTVTLSDEQPAA